jgi:hypothetical protein
LDPALKSRALPWPPYVLACHTVRHGSGNLKSGATAVAALAELPRRTVVPAIMMNAKVNESRVERIRIATPVCSRRECCRGGTVGSRHHAGPPAADRPTLCMTGRWQRVACPVLRSALASAPAVPAAARDMSAGMAALRRLAAVRSFVAGTRSVVVVGATPAPPPSAAALSGRGRLGLPARGAVPKRPAVEHLPAPAPRRPDVSEPLHNSRFEHAEGCLGSSPSTLPFVRSLTSLGAPGQRSRDGREPPVRRRDGNR